MFNHSPEYKYVMQQKYGVSNIKKALHKDTQSNLYKYSNDYCGIVIHTCIKMQ